MDWTTIIRRALGVVLVLPVLVLVFNPMVEVLRRATPNKWVIMAVIAVYVALCLWGVWVVPDRAGDVFGGWVDDDFSERA